MESDDLTIDELIQLVFSVDTPDELREQVEVELQNRRYDDGGDGE